MCLLDSSYCLSDCYCIIHMYKRIKMTLYNTSTKLSRNCYGNVQLHCTEKNENLFLANNLAEPVAGTNTYITIALQKSRGNIPLFIQ